MVSRPHTFVRSRRGLLLRVGMTHWPSDLPLPIDTKPWQYGDVPAEPYWSFDLEPERTIEQIVGIFGVPGPVTMALAWYQAKLPARGWTVEDITINLEANSWLKYHFGEHETIKLRLNLRDVPGLQLTWVMMQRIITEPYPLREDMETPYE